MPENTEAATARLLSLVSWIGDHPGTSVDEVAAHFGRNRRQMLRDVETLGAVGDSLPGSSFELDWDLLTDEDRLSVRTTMGVDLPPRLTRSEAVAVLVGLRAIAPGLDDDLRARLPRTAMAVAGLAPGSDRLPEGLVVSGEDSHDARLDVVRRAIEDSQRVSFTYSSPQGRVTQREVDPWELRRGSQGWVLRGWCHSADDVRNFRIERMNDTTELTTKACARHSAPGSSDVPVVRMRLLRAAGWVLDEIPSHVVDEDTDTLTIELEVWDRAWIESLLIDLSPHVTDVDPPELADAMRQRASQDLAVWDDPRTSGADS